MTYKSLATFTFSLLLLIHSYANENTFITFSGETIPLRGEWNLVMGSFLSYEEVLKEQNSIKTQVPGIWNNLEWQDEKVNAYGFGTYFTTIITKDNYAKKRLALEISEISLAYRVFINGKEVGSKGSPGRTKDEEIPKIDYGIFDFERIESDTLTIIFHVSNFSHESGGLWYAPNLGYEDVIVHGYEFNKTIKLLVLGSIIISGLFQLYIFIRRRKEKFALYFFLICVSLIFLIISRGDMPIMDLFPSTSWDVLKKIVYISIFLIIPTNALFLRELYPKYYHKVVVVGTAILSTILIVFAIVVSPRISYVLIPSYHIYNLLLGTYLFISLVRAAFYNEFGARFLLTGYIVGFITAIHDILKSQYVIDGFSFEMIHVGTLIYIFQLIAVLAGRYINAINGREQLSTHLRKVNDELEATVTRRTKELSNQNQVIELQNESLQKAVEEKDDLMAVVAHDLKAPFDSIYSISELLKKELKDQSADLNDMIKKLTVNGKDLIESLIQLKTYEQDNFQISEQIFFIDAFFEEKVKTYEKIGATKEIEIVSSKKIENPAFLSDESILSRIIDNLLSNAVKFSKKESQICFDIVEQENHFVFVVKDNGPGFNEKDKKKVFQKFQKLSARPTDGESSTGLGLSIAQTLTQLLNGKLELESEVNNGSEFTLTIPK